MKISEIIDVVKKNCKGYGTIDETKTRDKVLYGDVDKQCTGIVTTIYASYDVIKKASELGANFIIAHEALFWNHGDHTDWLKDNETFKLKKQLLDETGITVWRDHDYIHSGIMHQGRYVDGQQAHDKMLNIPDYWRNASQNHHAIPPHTTQNGHH